MEKLSKKQLINKCIELDIIFSKSFTKYKLLQLLNEKYNLIENIIEINYNDDLNVLQICEIPKSINIDILKNLLDEYMKPRISFYNEMKRNYFIEDEFSEYFISKSCEGIVIGSGNCGMDVKSKYNEGIDVMCVIMNKKISNEKSIIQNFNSSGSNLDNLFIENKDNESVELFMTNYLKKLEKVKIDKNLNELYIISFINKNNNVYLVSFKIILDNIKNVKSDGFVDNYINKYVNINIINFINHKYGKVNLYKSKKRVELRLYENILNNDYIVKIY